MNNSMGGIGITFLLIIFAVLWVWTGKQKRAAEQRQRQLRQNRKAQLEALKAEKRREAAEAETTSQTKDA